MIPLRALGRIGTGAALILLLATAHGQQPLRDIFGLGQRHRALARANPH